MGSNIYKWWQTNKDIKAGNGPINTVVRGNVADLSDEDINRLRQTPAMESQDIYSIEDIDAFLESNESDYSAFLEAKKPAVKKNRGVKVEGGLQGLKSDKKEIPETVKGAIEMAKKLAAVKGIAQFSHRYNDAVHALIRDADDIANQEWNVALKRADSRVREILSAFSSEVRTAGEDRVNNENFMNFVKQSLPIIRAEYGNAMADWMPVLEERKAKSNEKSEIKKVSEVKQEEIITKTETAQLAKAHEEIKAKVIDKEVKEIVDEKPTVKEAIKENDGEIPASVTAEAKKEVEDTQLGSLATKAVSGEKLNAEEKELASNLVSNQQVSSIWTRIKNRAAAYGKNRSTTAGAIRGGIKIAVLYFIAMKLAKSVDGIEIKGYKNVASNLSEMKKIRPWKSVRQFIIAGLLMIMANEAAKMGVGLGRALISKI